VLQATLGQLIPVRQFPRSLVQVTLQVTETPRDEYAIIKLSQAQQVCGCLLSWETDPRANRGL
jgi:exosome complex component RRP46